LLESSACERVRVFRSRNPPLKRGSSQTAKRFRRACVSSEPLERGEHPADRVESVPVRADALLRELVDFPRPPIRIVPLAFHEACVFQAVQNRIERSRADEHAELLVDDRDHLVSVRGLASENREDEPIGEGPDESLAVPSGPVIKAHGGRRRWAGRIKDPPKDCRVSKKPLSKPPRMVRRAV